MHIEHLLAFRLRVEHPVGRQHGHAELPCQPDRRREDAVLDAPEVPLQLHEQVPVTEDAPQAAQDLAPTVQVVKEQGAEQRAFLVAGQADQALGELGQLVPAHRVFGLGAA